MFVDIDVENDEVLARKVVALSYCHVNIAEAFILKILLRQQFRTVYHAWSNLVFLKHAELCLHIIAL